MVGFPGWWEMLGGKWTGSLQVSSLSLAGAQPALRVQAAVSSEDLERQRPPLACFQLHGFHFHFSSFLIVLLNLYSGNLNAFQSRRFNSSTLYGLGCSSVDFPRPCFRGTRRPCGVGVEGPLAQDRRLGASAPLSFEDTPRFISSHLVLCLMPSEELERGAFSSCALALVCFPRGGVGSWRRGAEAQLRGASRIYLSLSAGRARDTCCHSPSSF